MNSKNSSNIGSLAVQANEESSIIILIPCDYDSSEEDGNANLSKNSVDSSELLDDSDVEAEPITEIFTLSKKVKKKDETNDEINTA